MSVNNFDVLKRMAVENKDIRMGTDILGMKQVKAGSQITMGIAGNVLGSIVLGELKACLILFNKKQFDELKMLMEKESSDAKP